LQGRHLGAGVSIIVVDAPPGSGPRLHRHPYEETFIVQEGQARFTVGEEEIEARAGQILVVPAGTPHRLVNTGTTVLRQVNIHPVARMQTQWLG
jgi:quercetin dioxygenase-like cupin family protein